MNASIRLRNLQPSLEIAPARKSKSSVIGFLADKRADVVGGVFDFVHFGKGFTMELQQIIKGYS